MSETAKKTDPELWEKVKEEVTEGDKGGHAGQWSARKAQLATQEYKKEGGGYEGKKDEHNSLAEWGKEDWGTKSGGKSGDTGERYLPKKEREKLTDDEYERTTAKKRADSKKGKQFSSQPKDVAAKTNAHGRERSRVELYAEAKKRNVPGRSKLSKAELEKALG